MNHGQTPRVLIYTTSYLPFVGGAEIAIEQITKRIPNMRFLVVTARYSRQNPIYEVLGNTEIMRVGLGVSLDKWLLPVLGFFAGWRVIKKDSRILVWGMMISQGTIGAYLLKKMYSKVPFIITLQEGDSDIHLRRARFRLVHFFWKRILACADGVTSISEHLASLARATGFTGDVHIIPNGVDEEYLLERRDQKKEAEFRTSLGIAREDRVIISVSRLVRKNGIADLIDAIAVLLREGVRAKLLLLGDGEDRNVLEERVRRLGLEKQIVFYGTVPHSDLLRYYHISDVFVRPSYSEGLGNAFLEAMGAGVPVVATPVGGINDFLKDRVTGLFAKVGDSESIARAIRAILDDENLHATLAGNARALMKEKYMWSDIARTMGAVFITTYENTYRDRNLSS